MRIIREGRIGKLLRQYGYKINIGTLCYGTKNGRRVSCMLIERLYSLNSSNDKIRKVLEKGEPYYNLKMR